MGSKLDFTVDPKGDRSPSEQIASALRLAIASGALAPGERLPSVRQLAIDVLVNPNTVGKVWRDLERDGVLESRPGDGVFVAAGAPALCRAACRRELRLRLDAWIRDARRAGLEPDEIAEQFLRARARRSSAARAGGER
jgi:GntR family transcriptional regulator